MTSTRSNACATSRGFTLVELLVAGTVSFFVIMAGFLALNGVQKASGRQQEADEVVGAARVAAEVMARDLRTAGDSFNIMSTSCLGAASTFSPTLWRCAAVLDPHPWRVTIARNSWTDSAVAPDSSRFSEDDDPPAAARAFNDDPENAVTFGFVPYDGWEDPKELSNGRHAVLGRIERVANPFQFTQNGVARSRSVAVLLDNVVLDDAMRFNPADAADIDHRYDYSLFMYQLLTHTSELNGDASIVDRTSTAGDWFLTPPINLFDRTVPGTYPNDAPNAPPYMPTAGYVASGVGLKTDGSTVTDLVKTPVAGTAPTAGLLPDVSTSQLRYLLDRNRIRTIRVAFKVAAPRERPEVRDGLDLDGDPSNGTAALYSFESIVELKPLSRFLTDS